MKLLANENFPIASVNFLKEQGYDVKSIGDDYAGILDEEVILIAIKESRIIRAFVAVLTSNP